MDMLFIRQQREVEPILTRRWQNSTAQCCQDSGSVIDVGANFGWYTLLSLSLGCSVLAFEPVADYRDVLLLGVHLNAGFARRLRLFANVVFDSPGTYSVVVPRAGLARPNAPQRARPTLSTHMRTHLGMAAMLGPGGLAAVKDVTKLGSAGTTTYREGAPAVRIDDVMAAASPARDVCMLKVDVEGLEAHVLRTARRLLSLRHVVAVQLELTRRDAQWCANVGMLRDLLLLGFELRKVRHLAPRWHSAERPGAEREGGDESALPLALPDEAARGGRRRRERGTTTATPLRRVGMHASRGRAGPLGRAVARASHAAASMLERDLTEFSSNLLGRRPRRLVPGWALPDMPAVSVSPEHAACRGGKLRPCCRATTTNLSSWGTLQRSAAGSG